MPVFLVTPLARNAEKIGERIAATESVEDSFELPSEAGWLIFFPGTSVELSHALGVTTPDKSPPKNPVGSVLITALASYYGRGAADMWEWLKTRFEREG